MDRQIIRWVHQWSSGSVDRWIARSVDLQIYGSVDCQIGRSMDQYINGSLARQIGGSVDQWISRSVDRWIDRSVDLQFRLLLDRRMCRPMDRQIARTVDLWIILMDSGSVTDPVKFNLSFLRHLLGPSSISPINTAVVKNGIIIIVTTIIKDQVTHYANYSNSYTVHNFLISNFFVYFLLSFRRICSDY